MYNQPTVCASLQLNRVRLVQWSDCQGAKAELHPCVIFELLYSGLNLPQVVLKSHDESYVMICYFLMFEKIEIKQTLNYLNVDLSL